MLHGLIEARVPAMTANAMDVRFMVLPELSVNSVEGERQQ